MSNIDLSRLVSAGVRANAAAELRARTLKAACSARIFEVADQVAQTNMAAALAAGRMSEDDTNRYSQFLDWIAAMRMACRAQIDAGASDAVGADAWPELPASVGDLAHTF